MLSARKVVFGTAFRPRGAVDLMQQVNVPFPVCPKKADKKREEEERKGRLK
jgi:hypothetical protein